MLKRQHPFELFNRKICTAIYLVKRTTVFTPEYLVIILDYENIETIRYILARYMNFFSIVKE